MRDYPLDENGRTDVCMVVNNQLWNDARVKKEAASVVKMGFSVTVIAYPEEGAPEREEREGITIIRVPRSGLLKSGVRKFLDGATGKETFRGRMTSAFRRNPVKRFLGNLFHSVLHQARLLRHALATGARVYHAHDLDTLPVCAVAAFLTSSALVYDSHELWLHSRRHILETSKPFMFLEKLSEALFVPYADAIMAVTPKRAEVMKNMYPGMAEPDVLPNYPPAAPLTKADPRTRRMMGEEAEPRFIFLYQGILGLHRGLEELVDATPLLRDLPVRVTFVGHDASRGAIPARVDSKNAGDMITFLPPVPSEELPRITGSADCGLLLFRGTCLNHVYSLPNKLFEYMMAGLPIVACDLPEIAEVIGKHDCGILVDSSDPSSIASAMRYMAEHPDKARKMGMRGRAAAVENYSWNNAAEVLHRVYSRVLGTTPPAPRRRGEP